MKVGDVLVYKHDDNDFLTLNKYYQIFKISIINNGINCEKRYWIKDDMNYDVFIRNNDFLKNHFESLNDIRRNKLKKLKNL